ncbi:hypothetical protein RHGRI_037061 [Rhododendron griersonianum]|uniref:Uncharacterized protein n=2 Tax=Rhododendron griersonianum TaxID=479676 RepID=A0AAV6HW41_9ERIC|nr:hypothetical protein RHGRI_037061 [Rhododendron griersonianum]
MFPVSFTATMLAAQTIQLGSKDVVVAGGMESMSNAPKYLAEARFDISSMRCTCFPFISFLVFVETVEVILKLEIRGSRLGHDTIIDGMLKDGLWDVYNDFGMGVCAELCADQQNITRAEQDAYAIQSFDCGIAAQRKGAFVWEIVPVTVGGRGKPAIIVDADEGLGKIFHFSTDVNVCKYSDGAAALALVSGKKASELGLQVIAKIRGYDDAAQAPELFTTAPALAIPKAITNAGLEASQIDYYEINEAFSVVALANRRLLGISPEKLNVHGGAVSLGHPLGCSGACILVTLLGVLRHKNGKFGVAGICNGGGGASAIVVELM